MAANSKSNHAYKEMRRLILTNQILQGTRLREDEWSKRFGVSRMALREAFSRLLGEGLLHLKDSGGYFVKELTDEDVRQLIVIREVLEVASLKLAFEQISDDQIDELEQICNDISHMVERGYHSGAWEADLRFHENLIRYSGNNMLLHTYKTSHIPLFHQTVGKQKAYLDDDKHTDLEHRTIVKALREKDLQAATDSLSKHIKRAGVMILG